MKIINKGKIFRLSIFILIVGSMLACSGIRRTGKDFTTHAESIRILGYSIPEDDQKLARKLVPADGKITNEVTTPADWTSLVGILGNIFWIHNTTISGTIEEEV